MNIHERCVAMSRINDLAREIQTYQERIRTAAAQIEELSERLEKELDKDWFHEPEPEPERPQVPNLMAALEDSLAKAREPIERLVPNSDGLSVSALADVGDQATHQAIGPEGRA